MLAAREPSRNLALIEKLLSYGLFDWCVRDGEARFAYLLVRSLPLDAQERWKRLDDGKWFQRLEDNIPAEDVLEGRYRGVGKGAGAFDPKTVDKLTDRRHGGGQGDRRAPSRQGLSGPKAVELFRRLLQLGRTGTTGSRGEGDRQRLLQTAVQRLDTLGHMDRLLAELPDAYLLNEMWRGEVLEVLAVRDPRHLERQARALLSYGIFDWAVTAREAWLAYQLVRSLPAADQTRLEEEDPDRWARIKSNMTAEMRSSHGITAIAAAAGLKARDRIRDKLRDRRLWVPARETELRSLIIQLYALDDRRWVFLHSRDVRADKVKGLGTLVADLGLFDEISQPPLRAGGTSRAASSSPRRSARSAASSCPTPQLFGLLGDILGALLSPEMRLDDVDLELVQYILGGDIDGAELAPRRPARHRPRRRSPPPARRRAPSRSRRKDGKDTERRIDTNKAVDLDPAGRRPSRSRADSARPRQPDAHHAGHVGAHRQGDAARAAHRHRLLRPRLPPSGRRIARRRADRHHRHRAGDRRDARGRHPPDAPAAAPQGRPARHEDLNVPPPPKTIPIPVIGPLLNALSHILALTGTFPASPRSAAPIARSRPVGFLAQQFSSFVANQVTPRSPRACSG